MVALPENILSSLTRVSHHSRLARAYLQPVDLSPGETPPWADTLSDSAVAFQYWPESIQDSRQVDWSPRPIPGGSHPIYQWTQSGERRISFTAIFTTDTDPHQFPAPDGDEFVEVDVRDDAYASAATNAVSGIQKGVRDIDLRVVVSWLRWFTYPTYGTEGSDLRVFEPAKVLLVLPNTRLGHRGTDHLLTVMTQCDVTYQAWFPGGHPRIIELSLEFAEVVQEGRRIRFHDRRSFQPAESVGDYLRERPNEQTGQR